MAYSFSLFWSEQALCVILARLYLLLTARGFVFPKQRNIIDNETTSFISGTPIKYVTWF